MMQHMGPLVGWIVILLQELRAILQPLVIAADTASWMNMLVSLFLPSAINIISISQGVLWILEFRT